MKAEDLMIDDWVVVGSGEPFKIGTIDPDFLFWDEVQPIPLTPEILEKNGFIKHSKWDEWVHYTNLIFIDFTLLVDEDGFHLDIPNARINYVHELQHALRLCGVKIEIIL